MVRRNRDYIRWVREEDGERAQRGSKKSLLCTSRNHGDGRDKGRAVVA